MIKFYTIVIIFISTLAYSQDNIIYNKIFENKNNFDYLNFYIKDNIENLKQYKIYNKTHYWNTNYFKIRGLNTNDTIAINSIVNLEHHPYNSTYLFKYKNLNNLFEEDEKEHLYQKAINNGNNQILNFEENIHLIKTFPETGIYFTLSKVIYSSNYQYAFVYVNVFQDLDFFGSTFFIFEKENDKWVQFFIKKDIIF